MQVSLERHNKAIASLEEEIVSLKDFDPTELEAERAEAKVLLQDKLKKLTADTDALQERMNALVNPERDDSIKGLNIADLKEQVYNHKYKIKTLEEESLRSKVGFALPVVKLSIPLPLLNERGNSFATSPVWKMLSRLSRPTRG